MGRHIESAEAAALAGVKVKTFTGYVARGQAPAPVRHVGRTPLWDATKIEQWAAARPGKGARTTDRARRRAAERSTERSTD